ncbi:hypothetical protein ACNQFZ_16740 [Schinkia sp. CFF1]
MDSFFEFIFGNLGFLVIVIGAIVSILKRKNQNQKQRPMDKRVKPFIPPLGDLFEEIKKIDVEQKQKPTVYTSAKRAPRFKEVAPQKVDVAPKYIEEVETNPYIEKLHEIENTKNYIHVDTAPIHTKKVTHPVINKKAINKKEVINGVMWAEILGPPRARKKHSYTYLKRG